MLTSAQLRCDRCQIERGPLKETITPTYPPKNTLAVIVDISSAGVVNVHKKSDNGFGNEYIGMVGSGENVENVENLVIVLWEVDWSYRSLGDVKIKYAVQR